MKIYSIYIYIYIYIYELLCVRGGLIDHNISVILRYFLITSHVHLPVVCGTVVAILPIVKSVCNLLSPIHHAM